ncbi:MAG: DUF4214 domain-containing protein [Actinomycetota bacterium]
MQVIGRLGLVLVLFATVVAVPVAAASPAAATTCAIGSPSAEFSDQVDASAGHARIWRLYQAFFLRQPDDNGFQYWADVRAGGATLSDIAFQFAYGPEFQARYGSLSDADYVDLVYANVLCRTPDDEGRAYWAGLLASGSLTRWDMVVNFVELREYLTRTSTCHSIYPSESASVGVCPEASLVTLASASLATHGYRPVSGTHGSGSFQGVEVDMARNVFETGSSRCSVASINANWLAGSEKDRPDPSVLGLGVIDGTHVKGSAERSDRGVLGLRFDPSPTSVVEVWPGDTLSADDRRLNSVAFSQGRRTIESWHAAAELSPYLSELAPAEIVPANEWVWAAAGIPLIIDGQLDSNFSAAASADPYTYQTYRHTFVAIDHDTARLVFGGTSSLTATDLVGWAQGNGYEDLIKFDGGASAEFNIGGQAVVAGTGRDIPVWLGVGC